MKNLSIFLIVITCFFACEKEEPVPPIPTMPIYDVPCEVEEYFGSFLQNGECFVENEVRLRVTNTGRSVIIGKSGIIPEALWLIISSEANLKDTLFLETRGFLTRAGNASVFYSYSSGDQSFGTFGISQGTGTKKDFLIIDYFNADTTEMMGRFQCRFNDRSIAEPPVVAPDTMVITEGYFRVKVE